jgi:hypothetical protein
MMPTVVDQTPLELYSHVPLDYRIRDAERGYQLRAVLDLINSQLDILKANLDGLWDDFFIETCSDWVVAYIADLVADNTLHIVPGQNGSLGLRRRAEVAHTIWYRRRKGTLLMLEQLARDVTGWSVHAVAFFELLGWSQNVNHLRMPPDPLLGFGPVGQRTLPRPGWVNVRDIDSNNRIDGAFDDTSHSVDVRAPVDHEGWHSIRNVGFFLWRLFAQHVQGAAPASDPNGLRFSPLGNDAPLFTLAAPVEPDSGQAHEANVPGEIRPLAFWLTPEVFYPHSFAIYDAGQLVPLADIVCKDLSNWDPPSNDKVAVDVRTGRIKFGANHAPQGEVLVDYTYVFGADLGGGPYRRERRLFPDPVDAPMQVGVADPLLDATTFDRLIRIPSDAVDLAGAVALWQARHTSRTIIQIDDSRTYDLGAGLSITSGATTTDDELVIQAANGQRPLLRGNIRITATALGRLTLSGLLTAGSVDVSGDVREVLITHCTLVPGLGLTTDGRAASPDSASLVVQPDAAAPRKVWLLRSITGAVRIPADLHALTVSDSIVDAPRWAAARVAVAGQSVNEPAAASIFERSTVIGRVQVAELTLGSESIFAEEVVRADRRQAGCLRFSYVDPVGSTTPRRFRCQPDLATEAAAPEDQAEVQARTRPSFTEEDYGRAAFCQLSAVCPGGITTGAEDGSEMGAFCSLRQPQRETNLRLRLDEYLPFGLEPGLIHVT